MESEADSPQPKSDEAGKWQDICDAILGGMLLRQLQCEAEPVARAGVELGWSGALCQISSQFARQLLVTAAPQRPPALHAAAHLDDPDAKESLLWAEISDAAVTGVHRAIDDLNETNASATKKKNELETEIAQLTLTAQQLQAEVRELTANREVAKQESKRSLVLTSEASAREQETLSNAVDALRKEKEGLEVHVRELKTSVEVQEGELLRRQDDCKALEERFAILHSRITAGERNIAELQAKESSLATDIVTKTHQAQEAAAAAATAASVAAVAVAAVPAAVVTPDRSHQLSNGLTPTQKGGTSASKSSVSPSAALSAHQRSMASGMAALQSVREQLRDIREESIRSQGPSTAQLKAPGETLPTESASPERSVPRPFQMADSVVAPSPWKLRLSKLQNDLKALRTELGASY